MWGYIYFGGLFFSSWWGVVEVRIVGELMVRGDCG